MGRNLQGKQLPIRTSGEVGWMHGLQLELYVGIAEHQEKFVNEVLNEVLKFMYDNFIIGQFYSSGNFWHHAGNRTWNWTVTYSQSKCVKLCYQKSLFQACGKKN
jgi:hypothetical protein